jgi:hypothetical protein
MLAHCGFVEMIGDLKTDNLVRSGARVRRMAYTPAFRVFGDVDI